MSISQRMKELNSKRCDLDRQIRKIDGEIVQLQRQECQHPDIEHSNWWDEWSYDQYGDGTKFYQRLNTCNDCGYTWHENKSAKEYNETE